VRPTGLRAAFAPHPRRPQTRSPTAFSRRLRDTAEQAVRQELGDGVVDAELAHGATLTLAVALQLGLDELEAHSQVRAVAS